ncbi:ATP-binding cassette domain-containing protein [Cellulomonas sp. KRMCY2]|uniref:ABC transporter ATP-binding protein n=1 Tax=Cellulomonas sp. KRMCY2 TaxID=1304865 RepID=UPI00045E8EF3|nr:ATP-binding cassette domain-containing protein [Cellulomonas sp. KRMCY2]
MIRVEGLTKDFTRPAPQTGRFAGLRTLVTREVMRTTAVDNVSFEVQPGEMVGYLGPNGAGKSTTIKMMTGILVPTSGTVEVGGVVPWRDRQRNALQIGVVFGQRTQLWWDLPLKDSLDLIATLYRLSPETYRRQYDRFVDMLDMTEFLDRPVRQLSLGQRMRGDLAAAMLYQPRILYLDEPTIGLDVVAKATMRDFIEEVNREHGTTVVLTTHDLADVERLCSRVILIDHGRVLYDGTVAELKSRFAPHRTLVVRVAGDGETTDPITTADVAAFGAELVPDDDGAPDTVRLRFEGGRTAASDLIAALAARYSIADVSIVEPDLEGVVRQIYSRQGLPT